MNVFEHGAGMAAIRGASILARHNTINCDVLPFKLVCEKSMKIVMTKCRTQHS